MKKFFEELKDYVFFGSNEGEIFNKRIFTQKDQLFTTVDPDLTIITLSKKVHFLGKDRLRLKDVVVSSNTANKFNIGDYFVYTE